MSFENRFYTTKEMYAEYVHKILCRRIYHMGIPLTVLAFLGCILSFRQRPSIAAVEAVCGIIILAVLLAAPPMMVRQRGCHDGLRRDDGPAAAGNGPFSPPGRTAGMCDHL